MAYQPNIGERPAETTIWDETGTVVLGHVILHNGWSSKDRGLAPWPSDGATKWQLSRPPHNFDILEWELA